MAKKQLINIEIDKLTRSIENAISGDSFRTEVNKLTPSDIRNIKKTDWVVMFLLNQKQNLLNIIDKFWELESFLAI